MKNSKTKSILFCFIFALSIFSLSLVCFFANKQNSTMSYAQAYNYTVSDPQTKADEKKANEAMYIKEGGNIPFSLFTSKVDGSNYVIRDYYPALFNENPTNTDGREVYQYEIAQESIPYILLSSNGAHADLYNTTLFFKFNDASFKSGIGATISTTGYASLIATLGTPDNSIQLSTNDLYTLDTDRGIIFALNLKPVGDPSCHSPTYNNQKLDPSDRTGLYTFEIRYQYTEFGNSSNYCLFKMAFYVVDYNDYASGNPLTFENTDTFATNYQVFNYNYLNMPVVKYNAEKFALNFDYTLGRNYKKFFYNGLGRIYESIEAKNKPEGTETGNVTIGIETSLNNTTNTLYYTFPTFKNGSVLYEAKFDTQDFEKFLKSKNINSTSQGIYSFKMNLLVDESVLPNEKLGIMPYGLTDKNLVIFGFQLNYLNQNPADTENYQNYVELKNDSTWTNYLSYNDTTSGRNLVDVIDNPDDENGNMKRVPDAIAITNQAPLRFNFFGDLAGVINNLTAKYYLGDYKEVEESTILNYFSSDNRTTIEGNINSLLDKTYTQDSSFSSDGIVIIKLEYKLTLGSDTIKGTQYFVFEINNTQQTLNIQACDNENNLYDFETFTNRNVRVGIEYKPNNFLIPANVTCSYYRNYDLSSTPQNITLTLKKSKYTVGNKDYYYYVTTNSSNNYTFSNTQSGTYKITIKDALSNTPNIYYFTIDSDPFTGVLAYTATLNQANKYALEKPIGSSSGISQTDLIFTNEAFSLGWDKKPSGAKTHSYVYFMETKTDSNLSGTLFKDSQNQYYLTNGYSISDFSGKIDTYKNFKENDNWTELALEATSYFDKDGIYFFYVFDDAGNSFTKTILIDTSSPIILQGYWQNSIWYPSYDPISNPANYVNTNTTLYFGNYKTLLLPDLSAEKNASFEDISFTKKYNSSGELQEKEPITLNLNQIVLGFSSFVANCELNIDNTLIEGTSAITTNYFLRMQNNTTYKKEYEDGEDEFGAPIVKTISDVITEVYVANIYVDGDPSGYGFNKEAHYEFTVTNANSKNGTRLIDMNFDTIQGTYFAYNKNSDAEHYIRKNSGTNLDVLKFVYNELEGNTAEYYQLKSLSCDFYPFNYDDSSELSTKNSYPFSTQKANVESLSNLLTQKVFDDTTKKWTIDGINLDASGKTMPGKYILTRTYVGGTHNYTGLGTNPNDYTDPNNFVEVTDGEIGYYYYDGTSFRNLFEYDTPTRKYVVYVDHNGIVSSSYMTRNDGVKNIREIGDNISITLSHSQEEVWNFKEFFLMSQSNLMLDTNKLPIKINIPLSKYFVYYNSQSDNKYCKLDFATLQIKIYYYSNSASNLNNSVYVIDGINETNGYGTCSSLPNGELIFYKAGTYKIVINDRTGYTDNESNQEDPTNINPTIFEYSFTVSHTAPQAETYKEVYNSLTETFDVDTLNNESSPNDYYTNIKQQNSIDGSIDDNTVYINWADPVTPYLAKVNQVKINVTYYENNKKVTNQKTIDLLSYNLLEIAKTADPDNIILFEDFDFILGLKIKFFNNISTATKYDGIDYYRFEYSLFVDISKEYLFKFELSYVSDSQTNQSYLDENGKSFASSLYTLTIDRTKPNININTLLEAESYLLTYEDYYDKLESLVKFKEENFDIDLLDNTPSTFTYAFSVADNFKLTFNAADSAPYFYVRNYDKYNGEYSSITPDMVDSVFDLQKAYYKTFPGEYPRFSEIVQNDVVTIGDSKETWYKIYYNQNSTLKALIATATNNSSPSGFYEIIEKDYAGNYRCYTVYYNTFENIYENLILDGYTQKDNIVYLISMSNDANNNDIAANVLFEITKLGTKLGWGTITVKNETAEIEYGTIVLSPNKNIESEMEKLNNIISDVKLNSTFSFALSKYNATYTQTNLTKYVRLDVDGNGKLPAPEIEEFYDATALKYVYNLVFPVYNAKSILFLDELVINKLNVVNGIVNETKLFDYKGKTNIPQKINNLEKGIYKVIYYDNFNKNNYYYYILYLGEHYINNFDSEYQFEFNSYEKIFDDSIEDYVYVSGGDISITYEQNIYKVYVNNILYSGTQNEEDSTTFDNCKKITLTSNYPYNGVLPSKSVGGTDYFSVVYRDITDNSIQKTYNFVIFNSLPEITLANSNGGELFPTLEENTLQAINSKVTINWGKIQDSAYEQLNDSESNEVSTILIYTKSSETGEYKNAVSIGNGDTIESEGNYKIVLKNKLLNNYREAYFTISFSEIPLYLLTANQTELENSKYETFDITSESSSNRAKFSDSSDAKSIINVLYEGLQTIGTDVLSNKNRTTLLDQLGLESGAFVAENVGISNLTNIPHYYTTVLPSRTNPAGLKINYNNNISLNVLEFVFKNNVLYSSELVSEFDLNSSVSSTNHLLDISTVTSGNFWTTIFVVFNLEDAPIKLELFAVTIVPKTQDVINRIGYVNEKLNTTPTEQIALNNYPTKYELTNQAIANSDISLSWNATPYQNNYWYNRGNAVLVYDAFGVESIYSLCDCELVESTSSMTATLKDSGSHKLLFKDVAGNTHIFAPNSNYKQNYYEILLIDKVLYHLSYESAQLNPIQHGIFNDELKLIIDEEFIPSYHDSLNISVLRNGSIYNNYITENNVYTITASGRYVVTLTALYGDERIALDEVTYNFTLLDSNSARMAFEYIEIPGYEITELTRNGENILNNFKDENGKVSSLFISSNQEGLSGNGNYNVKLKYGKRADQVLDFTFRINNYIPTISCNVKHGETTTSPITISYNPSVIYDQLGECYVKILTYNENTKAFYVYGTLTISEDTFSDASAKSVTITRSNSYFIQVQTKNGNIISSFRVNKKDPLNTMAIIIIVIAVIAVVVLIIVIIKLRTRMKIK